MKQLKFAKVNKIGVIVPNYNRVELLEKCLNSLALQNYSSFTVYLIDASDCNKNDVKKLLGHYDKRIFHLINIDEKGVSRQRNCGINQAISDGCSYLTFVDSDDIVLPTYLSDLLALSKYVSFDLLSTKLVCSNQVEELYADAMQDYSCEIINNIDAIKRMLDAKLSASPCGKLYSAKIIKKVLFNENIAYGEDYEFNYRFILASKTVICSNYKGYLYYTNRESVTRRAKISNNTLCSLIKANYIIMANSETIDNEIHSLAEQLFADNFLSIYPRIHFKKTEKKLKKQLMEIVSDPKVKKAINNYKPYNKNAAIKKNVFVFSRHLYVMLFKIFLKFHNKNMNCR